MMWKLIIIIRYLWRTIVSQSVEESQLIQLLPFSEAFLLHDHFLGKLLPIPQQSHLQKLMNNFLHDLSWVEILRRHMSIYIVLEEIFKKYAVRSRLWKLGYDAQLELSHEVSWCIDAFRSVSPNIDFEVFLTNFDYPYYIIRWIDKAPIVLECN